MIERETKRLTKKTKEALMEELFNSCFSNVYFQEE